MTMRGIATTLRNVFAKEILIRLSGEEEFNCIVRYAGIRVSSRYFLVTRTPWIPSTVERRESGLPVRQTMRRSEPRRQFED